MEAAKGLDHGETPLYHNGNYGYTLCDFVLSVNKKTYSNIIIVYLTYGFGYLKQ